MGGCSIIDRGGSYETPTMCSHREKCELVVLVRLLARSLQQGFLSQKRDPSSAVRGNGGHPANGACTRLPG